MTYFNIILYTLYSLTKGELNEFGCLGSVHFFSVIVGALGASSIKVNGREVGNPLVRGAVVLVLWPVMGLFLMLLGLIGNFMLMAFGMPLLIPR